MSENRMRHLRVFVSRCWYTLPKHTVEKLGARAYEAIIIGYARGSRGYKLWNPAEIKVVVSRDVRFDESDTSPVALDDEARESDDDAGGPLNAAEIPKSPADTSSDAAEPVENGPDDLTAGTPGTSNSPVVRRSTRELKPPCDWWKASVALIFATSADPHSYEDALSSADS